MGLRLRAYEFGERVAEAYIAGLLQCAKGGMAMKQRERFWEFVDDISQIAGRWYFRSTDYTVEERPPVFSVFNGANLTPPMKEPPWLVILLIKYGGEVIPFRRTMATMTQEQAEAAHQWAIEQDLLGQSDQGVTRVDIPDNVTGF